VSVRPDLTGCWIFRTTSERGIEILLIRRAPGRIYPGMWQCVTGGLERDERVVDGALREVAEETAISSADIEVLYGLDQVNVFFADHIDALMSEAVFAAHVRSNVEPHLSHEHDDLRWVSPAAAREIVVWPAYRFAIDQIEWLVAHPEHARWLRAGAWAIDGSAPPSPEAESR
jgi:8-oxo-dGTP pyrophosphatase MutT (NUDIX family)